MRPAALLLALVANGCAATIPVPVQFPAYRFGLCQDSRPVRVLVDRRCVRGICGWSCLPERWNEEPERELEAMRLWHGFERR